MSKLRQIFKHPNFIPALVGLHVLLPLLGILIENTNKGDVSILLLILFILLLLMIDFTLIVLYVIARAREIVEGEQSERLD